VHRLVLTTAVVGTLVMPWAGEPSPAAGQGRPAAGTLRGRLHITTPAPVTTRRPGLIDPPPASAVPPPPRQPGVVYLEVAPQAAFEAAEPGRARLDQRNETFVPHVLAVRVGTVVDFPNNDRTYHNVFSLSKARRFDLGRYAAGHSRAVRFDRPGIVRVFCDIHSHMNAFILVFNHPYFSVTRDDGTFDLGRVPAGTYQLAAWYDGDVRVTQTVTIAPGIATVVEMEVP
jgi:plastocyanin